MALVLKKTLGLGGAVGLGAAATVFLGNIEGQLVIRPYLARLTRTELFILMTVGLSVIAGTVFVLYATILKAVLPGALGHLLVASMMSLPAGILIARIMVPGPAETELSEQDESVHYRSTMDAMAQRHRGRAEDLSADHRHADRDHRAGGAGQCDPGACCPTWRARR